MFKGSYVAIVTPFKNGKIDEKKFRELVEFQIKNGTDGIVPAGCTGEAATFSHDEQKHMMKLTCEIVNKRVPVVAGAGSNNTAEAVGLTKYAKKAGCQGALSIMPYYNKPTPEGQYRHYEAIAKSADIPIMIYNVPSRTGISIKPETVARLSSIENITAIKEASGSLDQVSQILAMCDITVLSGDDSLTLPLMVMGGKGIISVSANLFPKEMSELCTHCLNGDFEKARSIHYKLLPFFRVSFIETNPVPIKTAMRLAEFAAGPLRSPLCDLQPENEEKLRVVMTGLGVLK